MAQINTKEFILEKAFELFSSKNYEAVTISEISSVCGLTKGALYHHYVNKEELFQGVISKLLKELRIDLVDTQVTDLKEYIRLNIEVVKSQIIKWGLTKDDEIPVNFIAMMLEAQKYCPGFVNEIQNFFDADISNWEAVLKEAIARKEVRSDIDIHCMAINFFDIGPSVVTKMIWMSSRDKAIEVMVKQYQSLYDVIKV